MSTACTIRGHGQRPTIGSSWRIEWSSMSTCAMAGGGPSPVATARSRVS